MIDSDLIKQIFLLDCLKFGEYKLKNKMISPFYIDLRHLIAYPRIMKQLATLVYERFIKDIRTEYKLNGDEISICGLPYAGISLANYISCLYDIPLLILRKERKEYGTKRMIEGVTKKTKHIILIDDILTSGTSINESLIFFNNFKIIDTIVLVDREQPHVSNNIKVKSLFKITNILDYLKSEKMINNIEYDTSLKFLKK